MKPLRIFRHVVCEPPSYLCEYLIRHKLPFEVICLDEAIAVRDNLDEVSGLVFMGGAGSVNDDKQWIHQELELIQQADKRKLPVLGICFGAQLISKALGGFVNECETLEVGWQEIESICTEDNSDWVYDLPERFEVFQWHAHTFSIPEGATTLWQNSCCEHQGFVKDNMLATQFHLEVTEETVLGLTQRYAEDVSHPSECVQTAEELTDRLNSRVSQLHKTADIIYGRWLTKTGLM